MLRANASGATHQPQARPGTSSAPAEVHVHIGRIEVTALQAVALAKRVASSSPAGGSAATKPMSLDEYLARRRGGPSAGGSV